MHCRRIRRSLVVLMLTSLAVGCGSSVSPAAVGDEEEASATTLAEAEPTMPPAAPTPEPAPTTPAAAPTVPPPTAAPTTPPPPTEVPIPELPTEWTWTQVHDEAAWGGRAGLRVVEVGDDLVLLGGRTPRQSTLPGDSDIFSDVWRSRDLGQSWELILESGGDHWAPRAYFQATEHNGALYVIGGQDYGLMENPFCALLAQGLKPPPSLGIDPDAPCPEFLPTSNFFNDVWRSDDGIEWQEMTDAAPWEARAGLSAISAGGWLWVMAGSQNDDSSLIGPNGPQREYYNDVWRSLDGVDWELVTEAAPWEPRAGASVVVRDEVIWLFGGEDGFTCTPVPDCDPPYFNDVWRTTDGANWDLITAAAGWSPRPGHQCEVVLASFICFGGFGLVENPMDVWSSPDGATWTLIEGPPWNADGPDAIRYDFDSIAVETADGPAIISVGGDRETFDFADPDNWTRVDDDVWWFEPN